MLVAQFRGKTSTRRPQAKWKHNAVRYLEKFQEGILLDSTYDKEIGDILKRYPGPWFTGPVKLSKDIVVLNEEIY